MLSGTRKFDQRTGTAWLAFWDRCSRAAPEACAEGYQRRTLSTAHRSNAPAAEEARSLAYMIAAMIDGVWLRAALSE